MTVNSLSKRRRNTKPARPKKPYPDFPSWDDPDEVLNEWIDVCDESMSTVYREGIDPQRIIDVCTFVRPIERLKS